MRIYLRESCENDAGMIVKWRNSEKIRAHCFNKSLITEEFNDISVNDMHVIEAIGLEEPQASSVVARRLDITMGTLTKAIDGLNDKGYVNRVRSEQDKRVVLLSLTEKGMAAFHHHAMFHRDMIQALI